MLMLNRWEVFRRKRIVGLGGGRRYLMGRDHQSVPVTGPTLTMSHRVSKVKVSLETTQAKWLTLCLEAGLSNRPLRLLYRSLPLNLNRLSLWLLVGQSSWEWRLTLLHGELWTKVSKRVKCSILGGNKWLRRLQLMSSIRMYRSLVRAGKGFRILGNRMRVVVIARRMWCSIGIQLDSQLMCKVTGRGRLRVSRRVRVCRTTALQVRKSSVHLTYDDVMLNKCLSMPIGAVLALAKMWTCHPWIETLTIFLSTVGLFAVTSLSWRYPRPKTRCWFEEHFIYGDGSFLGEFLAIAAAFTVAVLAKGSWMRMGGTSSEALAVEFEAFWFFAVASEGGLGGGVCVVTA